MWFSGVELRCWNRPGITPVATTHSRARVDQFLGTGAVAGDAHAPEGCQALTGLTEMTSAQRLLFAALDLTPPNPSDLVQPVL